VTDVLVVGGGTGGAAAAIQAARRGAKVVLASEFAWLGGMLTAAGVAAPDGNELLAWQTGLWGAFLKELRHRQPEGLDHAWVSFFTYEPRVGAAIFAEWVQQLPNLQWIVGQVPREVLREGDRITGVRFDDFTVVARITLDGTELGDLLELGEIPYRWGWENQAHFGEPSAPTEWVATTDPLWSIMQKYPVQSPTWVVLLQDFGADNAAPLIAPTDTYEPAQFEGAWSHYGSDTFMNYGRLPADQFMINWPHRGNDYGHNLNRLIQGTLAWRSWAEEAIAHSQNFAHFVQTRLGQRYGLATKAFPKMSQCLGGGAFALMPYYRESRRLVGIQTVTELDILPHAGGLAANLPINQQGAMSAIAVGNYPNDHHYPGFEMPLVTKAMVWGGRWTGTPFTIPYEALVPRAIDGFMVCDKNISVSHIANGATRLQPIVINLGQAAGMAAALCVERQCEPRQLAVEALQTALLNEPTAPAAIVPLINVMPNTDKWRSRQLSCRHHPEKYFQVLDASNDEATQGHISRPRDGDLQELHGWLTMQNTGEAWTACFELANQRTLQVVTLHPGVQAVMKTLKASQYVTLSGYANWAAKWFQVLEITFNV
jgi:hypothetical protein